MTLEFKSLKMDTGGRRSDLKEAGVAGHNNVKVCLQKWP